MSTVGVAFLQNMWVRDPERAKALIERHGEDYRIRLMHMSLFSGCLTGRRIKAAFGDELLKTIYFEEASREIAGDSKTICAPDPDHIRKVLEQRKPSVVITFGRVAFDAVSQQWKGALIRCPHPAARQADTLSKLNLAAFDYVRYVL
jgi:hypothetical protein